MQQSNSARILQQIHRPILHGLCLYIILSTMAQSSLSCPIPSTQNRVDNATEVLKSVVQEVVNTSFDSINLTLSLTERLVQIIEEKRIKLSYECEAQTDEYLEGIFKANFDLDRVSLISINMTRNDCSEEVFIAAPENAIVTDIGYFNEFSDGYFPRFSIGAKCSSTCNNASTESDDSCECKSTMGTYKLLKRMSGCNTEGKEMWDLEDTSRTITLSCNCSPISTDNYDYR